MSATVNRTLLDSHNGLDGDLWAVALTFTPGQLWQRVEASGRDLVVVAVLGKEWLLAQVSYCTCDAGPFDAGDNHAWHCGLETLHKINRYEATA